ncbi:hypothetical protein tpqmel_0411 [Candidatus Gastranaerophilus sp. (ex Termes propinquus)]|nr:hypothetical protein tpqmel_0411 [Candidatus Gastranaerophilus sp. (ex Termes propinquus)]
MKIQGIGPSLNFGKFMDEGAKRILTRELKRDNLSKESFDQFEKSDILEFSSKGDELRISVNQENFATLSDNAKKLPNIQRYRDMLLDPLGQDGNLRIISTMYLDAHSERRTGNPCPPVTIMNTEPENEFSRAEAELNYLLECYPY